VDAWICGLRREQSLTRQELNIFEWDGLHSIYKINPIVFWSEDRVWEYIKKYNIPYNSLYSKGFRSIGCQPCTRAVRPGEDVRSGRWWWEDPDKKECGCTQEWTGVNMERVIGCTLTKNTDCTQKNR